MAPRAKTTTPVDPVEAAAKRARKPAPRKPNAATAPNSVESTFAEAIRLSEEAAAVQAPVYSRAANARNQADMRRRVLERERSDFMARINLLKAQMEAVISGLQLHVDDIDEELMMITGGTDAAAKSDPNNVVAMAAE